MASQPGPLISHISPPHLLSAYQNNAISSPLLRLPAELRILIFEYCLGYPYIVIFERLTERGLTVGAFACDNFRALVGPIRHSGDVSLGRHHNFLEMLQVCRQIYHEAHLIIFRSNILVFSSQSAVYTFTSWVLTPTITYGPVQGCNMNRPRAKAINSIAVPNCITSIRTGGWLRLVIESAIPNLKTIYVYAKESEGDINADAFYRAWMQESGDYQFIFL